MDALFAYADPPGLYNSSFYRVITPAKYLSKSGHSIKLAPVQRIQQSHLSGAVLWEREISEAKVEQMRGLGVRRLVVTFDDAYHVIPTMMGEAYHYWKGVGNHLQSFRRALRLVDKVVVPSRVMAREYGADYLPNYHDPEVWEKVSRTRRAGEIVIGWGGSTGHALTWRNRVFIDALAEVQRKNLEVVLHTYGDAALYELHGSGVRYRNFDWTEFGLWPSAIANFDIGIAPLSGKYDECRSNLKLIEYGLARVPFVATLGGDYPGAPGGILVENTTKQWARALAALIDSANLRGDLAERGRAWAGRYLMPERVAEYEKVVWG